MLHCVFICQDASRSVQCSVLVDRHLELGLHCGEGCVSLNLRVMKREVVVYLTFQSENYLV